MRSGSPNAIPFDIRDGWPEPLAGSTVTATEAGITLGDLLLGQHDWDVLRAAAVLTLRIDNHPLVHGWTTREPDGTETASRFVIPTTPTLAPTAALTSNIALSDWVWMVHGADGLLLLWDQSETWWLVNDPDLELLLTCAPPGLFETDRDPDAPFSWLPGLTNHGRAKVTFLETRYRLNRTD
jgi:hypothetical protein